MEKRQIQSKDDDRESSSGSSSCTTSRRKQSIINQPPSTTGKPEISGGEFSTSGEIKTSGGTAMSRGIPPSMRRLSYASMTKCVMIGDSAVGKTCILNQLCCRGFNPNGITNIGIEYKIKMIEEDKWMIWDTPGQERFRTIVTSFYRGADVILLVYDVTNRKSFEDLDTWINLIRNHALPSVVCFLVGNKIDCTCNIGRNVIPRKVPKEEALSYAADRGLCYFEVSAKDATNFPAFKQKLFQRRRLAIRERERQNEGRARSASVNLKRSERSGRTKNNCC